MTPASSATADKPSVAYFHIVQKQATDNHVLQIYNGKGYGIDIFYSGDPNGPYPKYGFALDGQVQVDIRGVDISGPADLLSCFTGGAGTAFRPPNPAPVSVISGNVSCSYVFGNVAQAAGNTIINGNHIVNGNTVLGNCVVGPLASTSTTIAAGYTCYIYSGSTGPASVTFKLPPSPTVGLTLPIYIQPRVGTVAFQDGSGGTGDVVGAPTSLPGKCLVNAPWASGGNWYLSKAC